MLIKRVTKKAFKILALVMAVLCLQACASKGPVTDERDPNESFNRKIYAFNVKADKYVLRPVSRAYQFIVPSPIRSGVTNFFNNIDQITVIGNDILQLEFRDAADSSWRFLINSTLGLGGVINVAEHVGLERRHQDFGVTMGKWGWRDSRYMMVPFIGPSTLRDTTGRVGDYFLGPWPYVNNFWLGTGLYLGNLVDQRAQLLATEDIFEMAGAVDQYAFIRYIYLQYRDYLITGEAVDLYDEFNDFDDWDDDF